MEHTAPKPPSDTGYTWHQCRCAGCREAHRAYVAKARRSKRTPSRDKDRDQRIQWPTPK